MVVPVGAVAGVAVDAVCPASGVRAASSIGWTGAWREGKQGCEVVVAAFEPNADFGA